MPRTRNYWEYPDLPISAFHKKLGSSMPSTLEGDMGKGGGDAPQAPDPYRMAKATTQTNQATALYNKYLNLGNYANPFGQQMTHAIGTDPQSGAPIFRTDVSASPQLSWLLNRQMNATANPQLEALINNQMGGLSGSQINTNNAIAGLGQLQKDYTSALQEANAYDPSKAMGVGQDAYYKAATSYLDPDFAQREKLTESQLAAQGIAPGSEAYKNKMGDLNRAREFAYGQARNSAITQGSQLGLDQLRARQDILNQRTGLLNSKAGLFGQQIGANQLGYQNLGNLMGANQMGIQNLLQLASLIPNYSGTATSQVSPADIAGYMNNQFQAQLGAYNAERQSSNSMMSGLMGLGGTLGAGFLMSGRPFMMSDRRFKRDITLIGDWNGTPVYSYRYIFDMKRHIGVMAQESPSYAVRDVCGVLMVDYRRL